MTTPSGDVLGAELSDVLAGGSITFSQLFETFAGSGQGAPASGVTIAITASPAPGGGSGNPVPATSSGILNVAGGASYSYAWLVPAATPPGDYIVTWTGTGGSNGSTVLTYSQSVTVAVVPPSVPAPGVYATPAQYRAWSGDSVTPALMLPSKLQRASEDIDRALMGAVYPTNASGMPTDALAIDVIMRATCAQAQWLIGEGDDAGLKRQYAQTSVGGVTSTRVASMTALPMPPLCPRALSILHVSGIVPSAALIAW